MSEGASRGMVAASISMDALYRGIEKKSRCLRELLEVWWLRLYVWMPCTEVYRESVDV